MLTFNNQFMKTLIQNFKLHFGFKDLISYSLVLITFTGTYFALQAEINVAKELPKPEINRVEFELKNKMIEKSMFNIERDISEIKYMINKLDDKIYEQNKQHSKK